MGVPLALGRRTALRGLLGPLKALHVLSNGGVYKSWLCVSVKYIVLYRLTEHCWARYGGDGCVALPQGYNTTVITSN